MGFKKNIKKYYHSGVCTCAVCGRGTRNVCVFGASPIFVSSQLPFAQYQEGFSNYRDAAHSNGVPAQPIIWRDSPCQGVIAEEMELSYDVKKGSSQ